VTNYLILLENVKWSDEFIEAVSEATGCSRFHLRQGYDGQVALDPGLISGTTYGVLS
jgi:hypothetical protein